MEDYKLVKVEDLEAVATFQERTQQHQRVEVWHHDSH